MARRPKKHPRHKRPPPALVRTAAAVNADENRAEKPVGGKIVFPADIRRPNPNRPPRGRGTRASGAPARATPLPPTPAEPEKTE